jgi:hypothetical protein
VIARADVALPPPAMTGQPAASTGDDSDRRYRFVAPSDEHNLTALDCGEPSHDRWLAEIARTAVKSGTAAVYVLLESTSRRPERV